VVASTQVSGSVDGTTFEAFISQKLVPKLWQNACVVMDNAKFHREHVRFARSAKKGENNRNHLAKVR